MSNPNITVDAHEVLNLFANLSPKKQRKVYRNTLKKGAVILLKETRRQLKRTGIKGVNRRPKKANWKSMSSGIKYRVGKEGDEAKVHIMGEFRLKFFEMGTGQRSARTWKGRQLKKSRFTGSIRRYNFFAQSKENKEREIFDNMNRLLTESIQRVANRQ